MVRIGPLRIYRLVILGGRRAGKSALAIRFAPGIFMENFDPSGEGWYAKQCVIDKESTLLEVLDTVYDRGEFNIAMMEQDMRLADGFLLIYSVTSRESFEETVTAYQQILRFKEKGSFSAILLASKCDLEHEREVGMDEGWDLARDLGCTFIETSAKENINVDEAFYNLAREIRKREPVTLEIGNVQPGGWDGRSCGFRGGCIII